MVFILPKKPCKYSLIHWVMQIYSQPECSKRTLNTKKSILSCLFILTNF